MKLFRALLVSDLRNLRPLLQLVVVVQVLRLGGLVGWFGTPAPNLDSPGAASIRSMFTSMPLLVMVAGCLLVVLSNLSPLTRNGFLATRPVTAGQRVLSRALVLVLVFWLPFVLVDLLALAMTRQPVGPVFGAVADTALWTGAWLAFLIPAFWLFRSRNEALLGVVTPMAAVGLSALAVWVGFEAALIGHEGAFFASAITRVRVCGTVAAAAVLLWGLLAWQCRHGWMPLRFRVASMMGLVVLCTTGLFLLPREWPGAGRHVSVAPSQVHLTGDDTSALLMQLPLTSGADNLDRSWRVRDVKVGETDVPVWNRPPPLPHRGSSLRVEWPLLQRLSRNLGSDYLLLGRPVVPAASKAHVSQALGNLALREGEHRDVSVELGGRAFALRKMAELPVEVGARDGGWTLVQEAYGRSDGSVEAGRTVPREFSLHVRTVRDFLNLGTSIQPQHFVLVDDENRMVRVAQFNHRVAEVGGSALSWSGYRVEFPPMPAATSPSDRQRLLIYGVTHAERLAATWQGRVRVEARAGPGAGLAGRKRDKEPADIARWMRENPAPAAQGEEAAVRRYLASLIGGLIALKGWRPDITQHPALDWLTALVAERRNGIDLLLQARGALAANDHDARRVLDAALAQGFSRQDLPRLAHIHAVLEEAETRGWLQDIHAWLLERSKQGHLNALEPLMDLPRYGGLTEGELFELFMENPRAEWYRLLARDEDLKARMERQIRHWFETTLPSLDGGEPGFPMELALAAGLPEAPVRLHRLASWLTPSERGGHVDTLVYQYFEWRHWPGHEQAEYFMQQDPTRFVFDPEHGKYRLQESGT